MDLLSTISGIGGAGGIIIAVSFLIYRCCKGRRIRSKSGCISIDLSNEVRPDPEESKEEG